MRGWGAKGLTTLVTLATLAPPGTPQDLCHKFDQSVFEAGPIKDQVTAIELPLPHYACVSDTEHPYCPGCGSLKKGTDCILGSTCTTCGGLCQPFDWGGNTKVQDTAQDCSIDNLNGTDTHPALCLPLVQGVEGMFSPLATYLGFRTSVTENNRTTTSCFGVGETGYNPPAGAFTVAASAKWGYLDAYGTSGSCGSLDQIGGATCTYTSGIGDLTSVKYYTGGEVLEEYRTVELTGPTFEAVRQAMLNMTFKPLPLYNSLRIKHAGLSPAQARVQPWFQVDYRYSFGGTVNVDSTAPGTSMAVDIIAQNDPPELTDPQEGFIQGCKTSTPCGGEFSLYWTPEDGPEYYFGQYWRWEGSSDPLEITGLGLDDPDADELCLFNPVQACNFINFPVPNYECGKLDFSARALIGAISLNSRNDLGFYELKRGSFGFTSEARFIQTAIRAIYYRVDKPELIAAGQSEVVNTNTQYVGAPDELVLIRLSDQGLVSADGIAQVYRDSTGDPGLKLQITIAAVNDPPTLTAPTDFTAFEDTPLRLLGLDVDDVDADEIVTSELAKLDWLEIPSNANYVNRVRITLELKGFSNEKGRGFLYLDPSARELFIVSNGTMMFISIESRLPGNAACSILSAIERPGVYRCDGGPQGARLCASDSDDTCNVVDTQIIKSIGADSENRTLHFLNPLTPKALSSLCGWLGCSTWADPTNGAQIEILNGTFKGKRYRIVNASETSLTGLENLQHLEATTSFHIREYVDQTTEATYECKYAGVQLYDICAQETTPEYASQWWGKCNQALVGPSGECQCAGNLNTLCASESRYLLHLNFTKAQREMALEYSQEIEAAILNFNKTCGGLPLRTGAYPLDTSLGQRCSVDSDCSATQHPKCTPGVDCKCCGNITVTCSANSDCLQYATSLEPGTTQLCGCTEGIVPTLEVSTVHENLTARYCCSNLTHGCERDSDCQEFVEGSSCGCRPDYPVCGPFQPPSAIYDDNPDPPDVRLGKPCTYRGIEIAGVGGLSEMYPSDKCQAPMVSYEGTRNARIYDQLVFYQNDFDLGQMAGKGSTRIEFYATRPFAKIAIAAMRYLTYNPQYPDYNRLYRLPEAERDPTTFKIDADDSDFLYLTANDMGNSGGGYRSIQSTQKSLPIVVQAVNDPPRIFGPLALTVVEDIPFSIINDPARGLYGINVTDPDQANFGFNEPRLVFGESSGFQVNLTVSHGCLFVDEAFLQEEDIDGFSRVGDEGCPLDKSAEIGGCRVRLRDFGQPKYGLHAVRCTDATCRETFMNPCYSDQSPTASATSHCYGRICTKFLAFEGTFPDISVLLANVTYMTDPDFNTFYGYSESLLVEVSDNGIIGDDPVTEFGDTYTIPITVLPVNDKPVVGRLHSALCTRLLDDGTVNLANTESDERFFAINPAIDMIDVNEDTIFTVAPDRLWIDDVDAEEAQIYAYNVQQCADLCGSVVADPTVGCCLEEKEGCELLCTRLKVSTPGGGPSEVIVEFLVSNGKVSFFPPPTRTDIPEIVPLTNLTLTDIKSGGEVIPCADRASCLRNQSRVWIRARIPHIQQAITQGWLTYVANPDWNGRDELEVWVSDDGYSDQDFSDQNAQVAAGKVPIDVIPINDSPVVQFPGGEGCTCDESTGQCTCQQVPPLEYIKGQKCFNNWMESGFLDPWPTGFGLDCGERNLSSIPNIQDTYGNFTELSRQIRFSDVDLFETPNGNLTIELRINRPGAGEFQISNAFQTVTFYQWVDDDELVHLQLRGKDTDLNAIMQRLYYNTKEDYSGPAPFLILASDNNNYGICTPPETGDPYTCDRAFCNNIFSGGTYENLFLCGLPVGSDTSLIEFFPGAVIPCSDIRAQSDIVVRAEGTWSGPWSCLGCGYYQSTTRQVLNTPEYNPSIPGLTRQTIDVKVGARAACKYDDCLSCNAAPVSQSGPHGDGCGWCPSFCQGIGKCMIGRGAPIFETCLPDPVTGLGYRQCKATGLNLPLLLGTIIPSVLGGLFAIYTFVKWIQRRHGSLVVYIKKKRFDITYAGRKRYLLPPETASWRELFYMLIVTLIVGLMLSGAISSQSGPFFFQQEVYLDQLTSMDLILDNCNVRFLPTRNFGFPTNAIAALKLRFAFPVDPQIELLADTCSPAVTFELQNNKDPAEKYANFYCNVQILVPDRFVVPTMKIHASQNNLTTVRGGPMDEDTQKFGLEFGSNEFIMTGSNMVARIENVSAKHLKYDVDHGSLLATNITFTPFGTFNSIDADIIVTTDIQTTVNFWQKSANLVCLSAATMYLKSDCSNVCDYVPKNESSSASTATVIEEEDFRDFDRFYRRSMNQSHQGRHLLQTDDACTLNVPGCTRTVAGQCEGIDSDQCRCKPTCDMVDPAYLDYGGYSGIAGTCNGEGKCCRTICGGYSAADLHPYPNSVECGLCQNQDNCNPPTCGTWTPGNLEQAWWFTSQRGQISVSVLDIDSDPTALHSYQSSAPSTSVSVTPEFSFASADALDKLFHPGGASAPIEDWFWLRVSGPGAPPRTLGSFAYLRSIRFLVLPDYFLQVVSNNILNPKKAAGSTILRPGYCPPVLKQGDPEMDSRIIDLQQLFSDSLQNFKEKRPFPAGSLIVWLPVQGVPRKFVRDPATNLLAFKIVEQWSGDGPILLLVVILTVLVPVGITTTFIVVVYLAGVTYLKNYRLDKLKEENTILNIYQQAKIQQMNIYDQMEALEIPQAKKDEMRARTSFFYMLNVMTGTAETIKTLTTEALGVALHLFVVGAPILYVNYIATQWETAYKAYFCESRVDQDVCYSAQETVSFSLNMLLLVVSLVVVTELTMFYLTIPYTIIGKGIRATFYIVFFSFVWLAVVIMLMNLTWIYLGLLQKPGEIAPYFLYAVGLMAILAKYFIKLKRFQTRVKYQVQKRLRLYSNKMAVLFPQPVVDLLLANNLDKAIAENGISNAGIVLRCVFLAIVVCVVYFFLTIGFQAFTNPGADRSAAQLNVAIVVLTTLGIIVAIQGDGDKDWAEERTQALSEQVLASMAKVMAVIKEQLSLASRIINENKKRTLGDDSGESSSSSGSGSEEEESEDELPKGGFTKTAD